MDGTTGLVVSIRFHHDESMSRPSNAVRGHHIKHPTGPVASPENPLPSSGVNDDPWVHPVRVGSPGAKVVGATTGYFKP